MSTVTEKGQATIPKNIRDILGILPGDEVEFDIEENHAIVYKMEKKMPWEKWRGYLGKFPTKKIMDELR